jgi:hypothetical protein
MSSPKLSNTDQARNLEIADTILNQLGYHRFLAMTGADHLAAIENGLRFHVPGRTRGRINWVEITLTASDEYDMYFFFFAAGKAKVVRCFEGVQWDQLRDLFTDATGLNTSL